MSTPGQQGSCGNSLRGSRRGSLGWRVIRRTSWRWRLSARQLSPAVRTLPTRTRGLKICKHSPRVNVGAIFGRGGGHRLPVCSLPGTIVCSVCMVGCVGFHNGAMQCDREQDGGPQRGGSVYSAGSTADEFAPVVYCKVITATG
jgi:hypothetical protein